MACSYLYFDLEAPGMRALALNGRERHALKQSMMQELLTGKTRLV